jgi:hypothetical protein
MTRVKMITAAAVLAVLTVFTGYATAQDANVSERTFLTFSNTVEMPGVTLPPGTYVFKLADSPSRNVVQVFTRDEKEILGQWTFVPAQRNRVTDENVIMFKEMAAGTTPAVQFWYYPGEGTGKEFIYPKAQADRIAKATGVTVLTVESQQASAESVTLLTVPPVVDARPVESQVQVQAQAQPEPARAPEPAIIAQREPTPVATTGVEEAQVARADTLPQTSSPLALSGLLGLLSLISAAGVRAIRK